MRIITFLLLSSFIFSIDNDGLPWLKISDKNIQHWSAEIINEKHLRLSPINNVINIKIQYKTVAIFPKKSSAYDVSINKILEVFTQKQVYSTIDVIFVSKKDKKFGLKFLSEAKKNGYDLIFSVGSSATSFVYKNYKGKSISVVSVCAKDPVLLNQMSDYENGSGNNFAFTSLNIPIDVQLSYLKSVIGDIDAIGVLYARKNKSAVKTQVNPLKEIAKTENIKIFDIVVEDRKNAQQELLTKIPKIIKLMDDQNINKKKRFLWITGSSSVLKEIETINKVSSDIPVLSVVPNVVKQGEQSAALSIGISFESNAYLASLYGINILRGKSKAKDMIVGIVSPPDVSINFLKLKEVNLKIPFDFFEIASTIYDMEGNLVKKDGKMVLK